MGPTVSKINLPRLKVVIGPMVFALFLSGCMAHPPSDPNDVPFEEANWTVPRGTEPVLDEVTITEASIETEVNLIESIVGNGPSSTKNFESHAYPESTQVLQSSPAGNRLAVIKVFDAINAQEFPSTSPETIEADPATSESSSRDVLLDDNAGGSSEVVYPDPAEAEVPNSSKATAPVGLRITSLGETSVTAVFEPTDGVSKYLAYLRHGDSFSSKGLGTETTFSFDNLTPDWDYTLCVSYLYEEEESNRTCLDLHTLGSRPVEPEPPTAPTNVRLQAEENSISVAWDEVAGAAGYRVCHVHGDNSWQCGGYRQLSSTSVIFDDGSIFPATLYGVTVVALDGNGRSSEQAVAYVTTPGAAPVEPELLPAPENIRIEAIDAKTVKVFWDYSSGDVISVWTVKVRRLTSYSSIGVSGEARSFIVENLYSSTGYEVILSGRDASGRWTYEAKQGFYTPAG